MTYLICSNSKNNKQQVERIIEQCLWIAMKKYYNEKEINQKTKNLTQKCGANNLLKR